MIFGKHINRYYLKYLYMFVGGILALLLVDYAQLVIPELYRTLINGMNGVEELTMDILLDEICLPMLVIVVIMVAGRFFWRICLFGAGIRVETDLRARMFDHSKELSQQYYQVNKVGNLMSLYINDLETVQDCFGSGSLMTFDTLFLGGLALFKMFRMNWVLALLSLIPMFFLFAVSAIVGNHLEKRWDARQAAFSDLSDFSQESFSGIAVIKAFVKETHELIEFEKLNRKHEDANVSFVRIDVLLRIFVTLFVESVVAVILGYGGYLVYQQTFNAGQLIEFIGYFYSIIWPVMAISEIIGMRSRGKASLNRISELLDAKVDVTDREDVKEIPPIRGDIEFRNLTFRYPGGDYDVLSDVSFRIAAGENVGIIGRTGAGKTTVVDLILRTYNVPDGTVFIDGADVNTFPIRELRDYAAYVPQDNFLFSDTIENNIAFSRDGLTHESVVEAAKASDVDGNITAFPDQYATLLGERGVTVSGGQKQRISIARALLKDAPILILDDSVSAVDTATERVILDNLRAKRKGKTTILIAHRISTLERMDKIVFLEDGRVLAVGTHDELCRDCAAYRTMVELQRLEEEKAAKGGGLDA